MIQLRQKGPKFIEFLLPPQKKKAGYTVTPVACRKAGAVFQVTRAFQQGQGGQRVKCYQLTDRWMDKAAQHTTLKCQQTCYRVYQLSCNIKNRCISASREGNPILKKVLKSPWKTIFAHAKKIDQSFEIFSYSQPEVMKLFLVVQIWLLLLIDTISLSGSHF